MRLFWTGKAVGEEQQTAILKNIAAIKEHKKKRVKFKIADVQAAIAAIRSNQWCRKKQKVLKVPLVGWRIFFFVRLRVHIFKFIFSLDNHL